LKNLFVGNVSYQTTEDELRTAFEPFGTVSRVHMVKDRDTGRPRGFAFVEMPNDDEASRAITGLHGKQLNGRPLAVNEARPRTERGPGGGGREAFVPDFGPRRREPRW